MTEDDIDENEVLDAIKKIKLLFNDDDSQEHIFKEPNGVFILIERQDIIKTTFALHSTHINHQDQTL